MIERFWDRLSFRQARSAVLVALALGFVLTGIQFAIDAVMERQYAGALVTQTLHMALNPAAKASFDLDPALARDVLAGLTANNTVLSAEIHDDFGNLLAARSRPERPGPIRFLADTLFGSVTSGAANLYYDVPGRGPHTLIGRLTLSLDPEVMAGQFLDRSALSIAGGLVRDLLLGVCLTLLFHFMMTRPIMRISADLSGIDPERDDGDLVRTVQGHEYDEIGHLVRRMNTLLGGFRQALVDRRRAAGALVASEQRMSQAIIAGRLAVWDIDLASWHCWCSPEFETLFGVASASLPRDRGGWLSEAETNGLARLICQGAERALAGDAAFTTGAELASRSGAALWVEVKASVVTDDAGRPVRLIGTMADVSERKRVEDQLEALATRDTLTDLPNRALVQDRLAQAASQAERTNARFSLMLIDLDRFHLVNDSFGHEAGDRLLAAVGRRLLRSVRLGDTVGRLGSDEFVVVAEDLISPEQAARLAGRILEGFAAPFTVDGHQIFVTPSIGISLYPEDGADASALLRAADMAKSGAKAAAGNTFRFFAPAMNDRSVGRLALEHALRRAIDERQFELFYQPKVRCDTLEPVGFEALIRWRHPEHGYISPGDFIPIAEETGLILPIGDWVVDEACRQIAAWRRTLGTALPVAVNISPRQIAGLPIARQIETYLARHDVPPELLEIELTESVMMGNVEQAGPVLEAVRDIGVRISVDDFGTGYSSLLYLKRFPLSALKLDRSFVHADDGITDARSIAIAIIGLGHRLGLKVIAEGVETEAQRSFLVDHGCDEMQGFLVSRPCPPAEAARWLRPSLPSVVAVSQ